MGGEINWKPAPGAAAASRRERLTDGDGAISSKIQYCLGTCEIALGPQPAETEYNKNTNKLARARNESNQNTKLIRKQATTNNPT